MTFLNIGEKMEQNIVEILVILLRQYPEGAINNEDFEPLTDDLIDLGYTRQEIETALYWFYNRFEVKQNTVIADEIETDAFRILHDVERSILSPEAYGYLIELRSLGIINLSEMDKVIEKAVLLGGRRVSIDDVKTFVATTLMEPEMSMTIPGRAFYLKTPPDKIQ